MVEKKVKKFREKWIKVYAGAAIGSVLVHLLSCLLSLDSLSLWDYIGAAFLTGITYMLYKQIDNCLSLGISVGYYIYCLQE